MLHCFLSNSQEKFTPINTVIASNYSRWLEKQTEQVRNWIKNIDYQFKPGKFCLIPDENGEIEQVLMTVANTDDFFVFAKLAENLAPGNYKIAAPEWSTDQLERAAVAWALGSYRFDKYKKFESKPAKLILPDGCDHEYIKNVTSANYWVSDLINTPNIDMGPDELAAAAFDLAKNFKAKIKEIKGEKLLKENFGAIYAVGKGSAREPRIIDIRWKNKNSSVKVTLVGKGICFDSGGLNLKPSKSMENMQKDMAGAAHALGLARTIMQANLPINLRVIIAVAENLVSGNSYKPGDIILSYSGKTIEVTDTDAEGRLVLSDALALACEEKPDLLLNFASLTGAARVALGTEITALFTNNDSLANGLMAETEKEKEPLWRMPLYQPYREYMDSKIADIRNYPTGITLGGAITAALFLKDFVAPGITWGHFDLADDDNMNTASRPKSGAAFCLRGILNYLLSKYGKS